MKHKLIIPAPQVFEFVSNGIEVEFEGTPDEAIREYHRLVSIVKTENGGVPMKEFEEIIQLMIEGEPIQGDPGIVEGFNAAQRFIYDLVRKIVNRIDYKNR